MSSFSIIEQHLRGRAGRVAAMAALAAAVVVARPAPAAAQAAVGMEWGMDVKQGAIGLVIIKGTQTAPVFAAPLDKDMFCIGPESRPDLVCATPDILLANYTPWRELELQTAPIRFNDKAAWKDVMAILTATFSELTPVCDTNVDSRTCYVPWPALKDRLNATDGPLAKLKFKATDSIATTDGVLAVAVRRYTKTPTRFDDLYASAQVNLDVDLGKLAFDADRLQVLTRGQWLLDLYQMAWITAGTEVAAEQSFVALAWHVIAARAMIERTPSKGGAGGDRKNVYNAFPKAPLGALLQLFPEGARAGLLGRITASNLELCTAAVVQFEQDELIQGDTKYDVACQHQLDLVKQELASATGNPASVPKPVPPRKLDGRYIAVYELRTTQGLATAAALTFESSPSNEVGFHDAKDLTDTLARFYAE